MNDDGKISKTEFRGGWLANKSNLNEDGTAFTPEFEAFARRQLLSLRESSAAAECCDEVAAPSPKVNQGGRARAVTVTPAAAAAAAEAAGVVGEPRPASRHTPGTAVAFSTASHQ